MSGEFLTELDAVKRRAPAGDGRPVWQLAAPLIYKSDLLGRTIIVPTGYETDYASVPRLPVAYLLTGDTAHEAAVVHDYLYSTGEIPRDQADAVFREAMEAIGEPGWRRWLMWAAVRVGGGRHYRPASA